MHRLLERQLRKCFGKTAGLGPELEKFVAAVDDAYRQAEEDRAMLERSMELSSRELVERNAELVVAENKYRSIFENATEGIFQTSPDGRFISANPALARMLGYDSPEELEASVTDIRGQLCVDVEPQQWATQWASVPSDGSMLQSELQVRRRDGSIIWTASETRRVLDENGQLKFYEGTVRDITAAKRSEAERAELQSRLLTASRQAGMAEVATGVLHNVGNVLNSINVSATVASDKLRSSKLPGLARAASMLKDRRADLAQFLTADDKGRQLPDYLIRLADHLVGEHQQVQHELSSLMQNIEHVKRIVAMQQRYAKVSGVTESLLPSELVEDALRLHTASFERHHIKIVRDFDPLPAVNIDKHGALQILLNLLTNAKHAMRETPGGGVLTIRIGLAPSDPSRFVIAVLDTGIGIASENLKRIFSHGFTTKAHGHGFGLHSSALAAHTMGGSLTARSDGPGTGATFSLELPLTSSGQSGHGPSGALDASDGETTGQAA
jgi:PAS domain S-box-containing protein